MEERKFWVLLRAEALEHLEEMKRVEKRSYANLIRIALEHYYKTRYADFLRLVDAEEEFQRLTA